MTSNTHFLRRALFADAIASAGMGLLLLAAAVPLEPLLGLPVALLRGIGAVSFVYAVHVTLVARREHLSTRAARLIVFANVVWVFASIGLLLSGWVSPTPLGYTFVIAQAVVVAVLAELQFAGLRRGLAATTQLHRA